jgi:hypothetical protein
MPSVNLLLQASKCHAPYDTRDDKRSYRLANSAGRRGRKLASIEQSQHECHPRATFDEENQHTHAHTRSNKVLCMISPSGEEIKGGDARVRYP